MTKAVFFVVIAVLVAVLYSIPSHARGPSGHAGGAGGMPGGVSSGTPSHGMNATPSGSPTPNAKAMQNSNGQFQDERKFGQARAAERRNPHATDKARAPVATPATPAK